MITIFNRKKLASDACAEDIARIKLILQQNNIQYESSAKRSRGVIGSALDASPCKKWGFSYTPEGMHAVFTYHIYVRKKDYDKAYSLVY